MSLTTNAGTQYYGISCNVPSASGININSNAGTRYYYLSTNDYILWGQENAMSHPTTNISTQYRFLQCDVLSESGLNLTTNAGTKYYYNSAFNCVSFCD
jgi:hypothetical protein